MSEEREEYKTKFPSDKIFRIEGIEELEICLIGKELNLEILGDSWVSSAAVNLDKEQAKKLAEYLLWYAKEE